MPFLHRQQTAITADEIAQEAEFFSFGTNDLTQMTCGFSRDDAASFLGHYVNDTDKQFYEYDPFATIDVDGVGKLMASAAKLGRSVRPNIRSRTSPVSAVWRARMFSS